jgi:hypothetical protein
MKMVLNPEFRVTRILQPFTYSTPLLELKSNSPSSLFDSANMKTSLRGDNSGDRRTIQVDIVADGGKKWIKVKASSLKGVGAELEESSDEYSDDETDSEHENECFFDGAQFNGSFNNNITNSNPNHQSPHRKELYIPRLPVFSQAKALMIAAQQHPVHYTNPVIVFRFINDSIVKVDEKIIQVLESIGIHVEREEVSKDVDINNTSLTIENIMQNISLEGQFQEIDSVLTKKINLDTTSLISLVSELCNPIFFFFDIYLRGVSNSQ